MIFDSPGKIIASIFGGLFLLTVGFVSFSIDEIDAGHVGVFKYQPYFFGSGGLDPQVTTGPARVYTWRSTTTLPVRAAPSTLSIHVDDLTSHDRIPLDFDIAITFFLADPAKAPAMIEHFGGGTETTFHTLVLQKTGETITGELMSFLRNEVRHYHSQVFIAAQNEDGTESDGASRVEVNTRTYINEFLAKNGAGMIKVANIALGRANPPENVRNQIAATTAQAQQVKTEQERRRAANEREETEKAVAAADLAYIKKLGLTNDQFIAFKTLDAIRSVCQSGVTCVLTVPGVPVTVPADIGSKK
ncbi:hypothetical protein FJY93_01795 [Candidatus Kaiserbacteria bacterium]|nr:hypothetical protein [Candidatus Kaiserbacteria bacterium]